MGSQERFAAFRSTVLEHYREHARRDLPWRQTRDPYAVLVSEVMLQQTQVARVVPAYRRWLEAFPDFATLAAAPLEAVLERWQGLGYNRRALALKRTAEEVVGRFGGCLPADPGALRTLPGVGPATAAGVSVFAYGRPAIYLETNVRAVFLHHFFADRDDVPDAEIVPLIEATMDREDPREWFYALLDYGSWLKRTQPNPSRRSRHHTRQSPFEGSSRQKRARLLRAVLADGGQSAEDLATGLEYGSAETAELLDDLVAEGFLVREGERYSVG